MTKVQRGQALKNLIGFRNWFRRLPKQGIRLDSYRSYPSLTLEEDERIMSLPVRQQIECGTVGCVAGWLEVYPPCQQFIKAHPRLKWPLDSFLGSFDSGIFSCRKYRSVPDRKEALDRLTDQIAEHRRLLAR